MIFLYHTGVNNINIANACLSALTKVSGIFHKIFYIVYSMSVETLVTKYQAIYEQFTKNHLSQTAK